MIFEQRQKTAVVTGASRGIGLVISQFLAQNNYHVIMIARNESKLKLEQKIIEEQGGSASIYICDLTNGEDIAVTVQKISAQVGAPDVVINNAGFGGPFQRIDAISVPQWGIVMKTNIEAVYLMVKDFLPLMAKKKFGRIINISSIMGINGSAQSSAYVASKHAIVGLTKSIAAEWGPDGITCNAICPGYFKTDMLTDAGQHGGPNVSDLLQNIPSRRFGDPIEIANMIGLLIGAFGSYVNGSSIIMDGGYSAHFGYYES
jgi:3-oxoacyl-[acyl-carrier protein] reductase